MLRNKIDGKFYTSIKALYTNTSACVQVNNKQTDWFSTLLGVRQGDSLSPTLFALYINDLLLELNNLNCGVNIIGRNVSCLAYHDMQMILLFCQILKVTYSLC